MAFRSMAFQKFSNPNEDKALTGRQLANSTDLPGHGNGATMISKVQHRMSDITTNPIANEDNVRNFYVPPETPVDDDMYITRSKFSSLVAQALEQQIAIDNQTSAESVKLAYTEGQKHCSTKQSNPLQSTSLEIENVGYGVSVTATSEGILQQTPQQRPVSCLKMAPATVSHAAHEQLAANISDPSTRHGAMDGNKTFPSWASDNTGRRYKRETNLKFSEGTVGQYESFRSQFIIHPKMLRWSNDRAGIELYMSSEGKAVLKVEEIVMNVKGMSDLTGMWDALDRVFLPIDHRESRYRQFATRRWHAGERMTEYMDK